MPKAQRLLHQAMDSQLLIAQDTAKFEKLKYRLASFMPTVNFAEATERIFSSSIETINTVGNVLFTENVAKFYQSRRMFKTVVCDSLNNEMKQGTPLTTVKGTLDFQYMTYAMISHDILKDMQHLYALCKQMMEVSDEEIDVYRKEREQIEKGMNDDDGGNDPVYDEIMQLQNSIDESKTKLKLE